MPALADFDGTVRSGSLAAARANCQLAPGRFVAPPRSNTEADPRGVRHAPGSGRGGSAPRF